MTLADLTNTLTGKSYHATRVTEAITLASNIATGLRKATYAFGDNDTVDSGVSMLAARILTRSRNEIKNKTADSTNPLDNASKLVTEEIKLLIRDDISGNKFPIRYSSSPSTADYYAAPGESLL